MTISKIPSYSYVSNLLDLPYLSKSKEYSALWLVDKCLLMKWTASSWVPHHFSYMHHQEWVSHNPFKLWKLFEVAASGNSMKMGTWTLWFSLIHLNSLFKYNYSLFQNDFQNTFCAWVYWFSQSIRTFFHKDLPIKK